MLKKTLMSPDLARAARALSQVSAKNIADSAGMSKRQLHEYERGRQGLDEEELRRLRRTLEEFGIRFVPEDDDGGYGVRQKFNSRKVRALEQWEDEGGPAYDDDI
ncbi:helix-turn-helix domain-containing protein [Spelaeicoccus albus]|uniref:Transcriptional regulator with XRE-family HTH domain n=1 Tax=Spelaeicoccus albus TaxID=1280376 RepID=A0A7Z0D586_9MICO|nr:helix-turn-helix transcriptional regulator [Spelaeicoccus albus]NYI69134.1 transcriptional regulator with XRE-family HTH domain [Spelaeicoccus albus]